MKELDKDIILGEAKKLKFKGKKNKDNLDKIIIFFFSMYLMSLTFIYILQK